MLVVHDAPRHGLTDAFMACGWLQSLVTLEHQAQRLTM